MAQNFLLWSEDFTQAIWTKQTGVVITPNSAVAPDGTTTASKLDLTSCANQQGLYQQLIATSVQKNSVSRSIWVKGTAGESFVLTDPVGGGSVFCTCDGTWQRVYLTINDGPSANPGLWIQKANTGTMANILYIWGAQMSETKGPVAYVKTTSAIINSGVPRSQPPRQNLLVRTNSLLTSTGWTTLNATLALVAGDTGPFGEAVYRIASNTAASVEHLAYQPVTLANVGARFENATATTSVVMRAGSSRYGAIRCDSNSFTTAVFDLVNGVVSFVSTTAVSAGMESMGNGWYRCRLTWRVDAARVTSGTEYAVFGPSSSTSLTYADAAGYVDVSSPQMTLANGDTAYVANAGTIAINEGTPRARAVTRQNLILQSSDLTSATWSKDVGLTVTSMGDGSFVINDTSSTALTQIAQAFTNLVRGRVYTCSFKVAKTTGATNTLTFFSYIPGNAIALRINTNSGEWADNGVGAGSGGFNQSVTDAGDGYWQVSVSFLNDNTPGNGIGIYPAWATNSGTAPGPNSGTNSVTGSHRIRDWMLTEARGMSAYVATGATAVNDGAPRGLLGRQNLLLQSTIPSTTTPWSVQNITVAALAETGPTGETVYRLASNTVSNLEHVLVQNRSLSARGGAQWATQSAFVRAGTASYAILRDATGGYVVFDLVNGVYNNLATNGSFARIDAIPGTSWWRISYTYPATGTGGNDYYCLALTTTIGSNLFAATGLYIDVTGLQWTLSNGPAAYVPNPSTTNPLDEGAPRGRAPLQNIIRGSQSMSDVTYWSLSNTIVTANQATAPDGSISAALVSDGTGGGVHQFSTAIIGGTYGGRVYCLSCFVKRTTNASNNVTFVYLSFNGGSTSACYDLVNVLSRDVSAIATAGIEPVGTDGWFRIWLVAPYDGANSNALSVVLAGTGTSPTVTYTGANNTLYAWGAQITESNGLAPYVATDARIVSNGVPRGRVA